MWTTKYTWHKHNDNSPSMQDIHLNHTHGVQVDSHTTLCINSLHHFSPCRLWERSVSTWAVCYHRKGEPQPGGRGPHPPCCDSLPYQQTIQVKHARTHTNTDTLTYTFSYIFLLSSPRFTEPKPGLLLVSLKWKEIASLESDSTCCGEHPAFHRHSCVSVSHSHEQMNAW